MGYKTLIIGNGVAGVEAAVNIRKENKTADLKIISSYNYNLYYRPRLIEYLSGNLKLEEFIIYKDDFYKKNNIKNILNEKIIEIDSKNQIVRSEAGNTYDYDKLLIATGASSFVPPIPGAELNGVFTLRSLVDAEKIINYASDKKNIVIIGGGLLGIEIANSLKKKDNNIIVIEMFDRLLPRQLDVNGASLLKNILEHKGLNFILGTSVSRIVGDKKVEKVKLKDNKEILSECVIISAGIKPNIELAKNSGIETNKGIIINNRFETSINNIFAAGDCSEHNGKVYGLWSVSKEQGKLAGLSMTGKDINYKGSSPSTTLKVTGIDLFSAGQFDADNNSKIYTKLDDKSYLKIVIQNDKIIGAIAIGNRQAAIDFKSVMSNKKSIEVIKKYFKKNHQ